MDRLATWLDRIYPKMAARLEENLKQRCFDSYEVFWDEERGSIEDYAVLHSDYDFIEANLAVQRALNQVAATEKQDAPAETEGDDDWSGNKKAGQEDKKKSTVAGLDNNYQVVSLDWNCNGSSLVAAYGKTNHVTWCEH